MVTAPYLVFEWLLTSAFVRAAQSADYVGTPGTLKAKSARDKQDAMSARTYLKAPSIFGFHGVYKPLAREVGILDDDFGLYDAGRELLNIWQEEQKQVCFLKSSTGTGPGDSLRNAFRSAVESGLQKGCLDRSETWQGWNWAAVHLAPRKAGKKEGQFIYKLLRGGDGSTRGEVFELLREAPDADLSEAEIVEGYLIPYASAGLRDRLVAIRAFEQFANLLEDAFDWIRYLSSGALFRPINVSDYEQSEPVCAIAAGLELAFDEAVEALEKTPPRIQREFVALCGSFGKVKTPGQLFESVLAHHHKIQDAKPPDGKRDWFEKDANGAAYARPPYRLLKAPSEKRYWRRPYRVSAARLFWADLRKAAANG
jgi:hypothetical protein